MRLIYWILLGSLATNGQLALANSSQIPKPTRAARSSNIDSVFHPPARASQSEPQSDGRTLAGHSFMHNNVVALPFSAPFINSSLEAAMATLRVSGADNDIKTVGLSPSINGQFHVGPLGMELGGQLAEIFGSDSYSAYVLGANFTYGYSAAARVEVVRSGIFAITPALFYSWEKGIGFSPLIAAYNTVTSPTQAIAKNILINTYAHQLRPSLLVAIAPDPVVGFSLEGGVGFAFDSSSTPDTYRIYRLGIAADLDLKSAAEIPLAIDAFFRDEIPSASNIQPSPLLGAGLYEKVNRSFHFGIELTRLMTSTPTLSANFTLTGYY